MPTTVGSLIVFVGFLGPGLAYLLTRDSRRAKPERSPFREIATLVLGGLACNIFAALLFGVGRWLWPGTAPDIGALIRDPATYGKAHYAELWFAGLSFLAIALLGAVFLGHQDFPQWVLRRLRGSIAVDSAWEQVFNSSAVSNFDKYCGCALEDGTWLVGQLASSSPDSEETADRDLILAAPIRYRDARGRLVVSNAQRAVISARRIAVLEVYYYEHGTDPFPHGRRR